VLDGVAGGGTSSVSGWMMYVHCRRLADNVVKTPCSSNVCVLSALWRTLSVLTYRACGVHHAIGRHARQWPSPKNMKANGVCVGAA
jgi:hypothetical protein